MAESSLPQTAGFSGSADALQDWAATHVNAEVEELRALARVDDDLGQRKGRARNANARLADGGVEPGPRPGPSTGGVSPATPLSSFFAYVNSRPDKDWNTCGQAAVASMVDFHGGDLGLPRQQNGHWDHGQAIDKVIQAGFGSDVVFGWGTSPGRIRDALNHFGVPAQSGNSGVFFSGWTTEWNRLLAYVYYSALPVPVLVDMGILGGTAFGGHWPILWKMQSTSTGMVVHLGNWNPTWQSLPIPAEKFLEAWACRHLPYGFNHGAVYTGRPKVSF